MNIFFWLVVIGGLFIIIGAFSFKKERHLKKVCTAVAQAKVVEIEKGHDEHNNCDTTKNDVYTPIYEYTTVEERILSVKGMSSKGGHKVGDTAQIYYNPDEPSEFYVGSSSGFSDIGVIFTLIGLIIALIGLAKI